MKNLLMLVTKILLLKLENVGYVFKVSEHIRSVKVSERINYVIMVKFEKEGESVYGIVNYLGFFKYQNLFYLVLILYNKIFYKNYFLIFRFLVKIKKIFYNIEFVSVFGSTVLKKLVDINISKKKVYNKYYLPFYKTNETINNICDQCFQVEYSHIDIFTKKIIIFNLNLTFSSIINSIKFHNTEVGMQIIGKKYYVYNKDMEIKEYNSKTEFDNDKQLLNTKECKMTTNDNKTWYNIVSIFKDEVKKKWY